MYQMAYSDYVWTYFVPLVFVGAFFLLNLTLAVINSSFSRTHKHYADLEEQAKQTKKKPKSKDKGDGKGKGGA